MTALQTLAVGAIIATVAVTVAVVLARKFQLVQRYQVAYNSSPPTTNQITVVSNAVYVLYQRVSTRNATTPREQTLQKELSEKLWILYDSFKDDSGSFRVVNDTNKIGGLEINNAIYSGNFVRDSGTGLLPALAVWAEFQHGPRGGGYSDGDARIHEEFDFVRGSIPTNDLTPEIRSLRHGR